jgi:hypothetical protein
MLEEAYNLILEAKKKKLTPKEKKIAGAAEPYDKITRADIITLAKNKNKKTNNESTGLEQAYNQQDEVAAKKIAEKLKGTPNLNIATIKMYVAKYLPMIGKGESDVDHLTALVHDNLSELGLVEASAGIEDQEEYHCDYAADGCDCDGCEECKANQKKEVQENEMKCEYAKKGCDCNGCKECIKNQKEEVKEEAMPRDFKVGDMVTLNHPNYPAMTGKKFTVQQSHEGKCDLVGVDQHGYSEPRNGVFWVDNEYLAPLS